MKQASENQSSMQNSVLGEDLDNLAYSVIGAAVEVHRLLGAGYPEAIYAKALGFELELRGIAFACEVPVQVTYKGRYAGEGRIDILVADALVVELKTVETLLPIHTSQLLSYLKTTNLRLGLLINFNTTKLKDGGIKRFVYNPPNT